MSSPAASLASRSLENPLYKITVNLKSTYAEADRRYNLRKQSVVVACNSKNQKQMKPLTRYLADNGWFLAESLGMGGFAETFRVTKLSGKEDRVVKLFHSSLGVFEKEQEAAQALAKEAPIPHAAVYAVIDPKYDCRALMTEYLPGRGLFEYYYGDDQKYPTVDELISIAFQVLEFAKDFHQRKLVHGDLKPENVMFDGKKATVIDFGHAHKSGELSTGVPSFLYRAPELFLKPVPVDTPADMWGIGAMLFSLYIGDSLLLPPDKETEKTRVSAFQFSMPYLAQRFGKDTLKEFLKNSRCTDDWKEQPPRAYPWKKAIERKGKDRGDSDAQVKAIIGLLEPMFKFENRITAEEALKNPIFSSLTSQNSNSTDKTS